MDKRYAVFIYGLTLGIAGGLYWQSQRQGRVWRRVAKAARQGEKMARQTSAQLCEAMSDSLDRGKKAAQVASKGLSKTYEASREALVG